VETHRVHLWLDGKRTVDFLFAIIELYLLAHTAAALLIEICRNRRFLKEFVVCSIVSSLRPAYSGPQR